MMLEVFFSNYYNIHNLKILMTRAGINIGLVEAFAPGWHIFFDVQIFNIL